MSLEQRSPEPDPKDKKLTRAQRGPFLASWLARTSALEGGEIFGEESGDDVEKLDTDWGRFRKSWHKIFSGVKVPGLTKDSKRSKKKKHLVTGDDGLAVVSDLYKGELDIPHEEDLDGTSEDSSLDLSGDTPSPPVDDVSIDFDNEPLEETATTPAKAPEKPLERSLKPMPLDFSSYMATPTPTITRVLEDREPVSLAGLTGTSSTKTSPDPVVEIPAVTSKPVYEEMPLKTTKRREYLAETDDAPVTRRSLQPAVTPRASAPVKPRQERYIAPLSQPEPANMTPLPELLAAGEPEETPLDTPGETVQPAVTATDEGTEVKPEDKSLSSGGATHVADILSSSPLFNPGQPIQLPVPEAEPAPYRQPVPKPLTPSFEEAPAIDNSRYIQAIKNGFWGGVIVTAVLALLYVIT